MPETELVQAAPVESAPPETPNVPADDSSLADHIAAFHAPEATPEPTETATPEKKRHRSAKNWARPEDVPRIKALTAERDEWKTKYEQLQATREAPQADPTPMPQPARSAPAAPAAFTEAEPKIEDFASDPDPYTAWTRALARYDRRKEAHEAQQTAYQSAQQDAETAQLTQLRARAQQDFESYHGRLSAYLQQHPDRKAAFESREIQALNAAPIVAAITRMDNGPDIVYHLQQQPALLAELHLLVGAQPAHDAVVASVTSWLQHRVSGVGTGASASVTPPPTPAPRPPTPVRTTPTVSGSEPPGDGASLREHRQFFHRAR